MEGGRSGGELLDVGVEDAKGVQTRGHEEPEVGDEYGEGR